MSPDPRAVQPEHDSPARIDAGATGRRRPNPLWRPFVVAAIATALTAGFLGGSLLFIARESGHTTGSWQTATAQAHGHAQVFGWAGLMVLGVGLEFLPRLAGVGLERPRDARVAFALLAGGVALRVVGQPAAALTGTGGPRTIALASFGLSGVLELAGTTLVFLQLGDVLLITRPQRKHSGVEAVLPLFGLAFSALWLAMALNAVAVGLAALRATAVVRADLTRAIDDLGLLGFLVPVSIAMSARLFPLYVQTLAPRLRWLRGSAAALGAGLLVRLVGELTDVAILIATGRVLQALGIVAGIVAVGVFAKRRQLPRRQVQPLREPIQLHALTAYGWLVVAGVLLLLNALRPLGLHVSAGVIDPERHALGAGFVTLLILGMGAELIPGFARARLRSPALIWWTLVLANAAALMRVGPLLLPGLPTPLRDALLSGSGFAGLAAVAIFARNLPLRRRSRQR